MIGVHRAYVPEHLDCISASSRHPFFGASFVSTFRTSYCAAAVCRQPRAPVEYCGNARGRGRVRGCFTTSGGSGCARRGVADDRRRTPRRFRSHRVGDVPAQLNFGELATASVVLANESGIDLKGWPPHPVHLSHHWLYADTMEMALFEG